MMGGAPVIEWIRSGVGFTPPAAASFRRAEASWRAKTGRPFIDCNSSYRDYGTQLSMWQAWTAWTEGWGPKPKHSRALHPDASKHTQGLALDSDDWVIPGFIAHMADHGWIRTAANDPTERHHFEYQWWRDNHRNDPTPENDDTPENEDDIMGKPFFDNGQRILWPNGFFNFYRNDVYHALKHYFEGSPGNEQPGTEGTVEREVWTANNFMAQRQAETVARATIEALKASGIPVEVDVDEAEIAKIVVAALPKPTLDDETLDELAERTIDEQDRRARERLND